MMRWRRIAKRENEEGLRAEKSTLWTDTGVDQNFQRDLRAIGPYEFQGKLVWTNAPFALFSGKFVWTNGTECSSIVCAETGIGPWMALPSQRGSKFRNPGAYFSRLMAHS